jgi:hypothetical protein
MRNQHDMTDGWDAVVDQKQDRDLPLSKASFDDLYVQPDPRAYFRGLGALDY